MDYYPITDWDSKCQKSYLCIGKYKDAIYNTEYKCAPVELFFWESKGTSGILEGIVLRVRCLTCFNVIIYDDLFYFL